jgi:hypothetical protein
MTRQSVSRYLGRSLESPEIRRAMLRLAEELTRRPVRAGRTTVIELGENAEGFNDVAPGTVTAFVAREGEPTLGRLTAAAKAGNAKDFAAAAAEVRQLEDTFFRRVSRASIHGDSGEAAIPSFAEIGYAGKTLIDHIYADDTLRVNVHVFPYNGGQLDRNRFTLVEHYQADCDTPLTALLVVHKPRLSAIENEALALVPPVGSANNIGVSALRAFTPVLVWVGEAAAAAAVGWVVGKVLDWAFGFTAISALPDDVLQSDDFQRKLKTLPPEATAAELVRLRTELLLRKAPATRET